MRLLLVLAIVWLFGTCTAPLPGSPADLAWTTFVALFTLLTPDLAE